MITSKPSSSKKFVKSFKSDMLSRQIATSISCSHGKTLPSLYAASAVPASSQNSIFLVEKKTIK